MKKILLSSLAVLTLLSAGVAKADNDFYTPSHSYAVMQLGYGMGKGDYKENGIANVGLGYHFNDYMRTDLTVGWRGLGEIEMDDQKTDIWSIPALINVYAKMPISRGFSVYGMGGLGMAMHKTDDKADSFDGKTKFDFAWNLGAGIDYHWCPNVSFDLGYRYSDLGQAKVKASEGYTGKTEADVRSHDILLSMRYYF